MKGFSILLKEHVRKRLTSYFLITLMLFAGMVSGVICTKFLSVETEEEIYSVLDSFIGQSEKTFLTPSGEEIVYHFLSGDLLQTIVIIWVLGLTVIGTPIVLGIIFFRGFALGFTAAYLIKEFLWTGVLLTIVGLVPQNLFALLGILITGTMSLWFAGGAVRILFGKKNDYSILRQFSSATFFTLIGGALGLLATLIEAYISPVLLSMISKYLG